MPSCAVPWVKTPPDACQVPFARRSRAYLGAGARAIGMLGLWCLLAGCELGRQSTWPPVGASRLDAGGASDSGLSDGEAEGGETDGALMDTSAPGDTTGDVGADATDTLEPDANTEPVIEVFSPGGPGLYASFHERAFRLPLGISTAGYGQAPPADKRNYSPYSSRFFSTRHQYGQPGARALTLYKGDELLILVAMDLIAVRENLLQGVLDRLLAKTGRDFTDSLILAANHSHSGPARWIPHPIAGIVADDFHRVVHDRLCDEITDIVASTLSTAERVAVGTGFGQNSDMHNDRRCENPPLEDGTMGVMALRRTSDDSLLAVVLNYGVHGTAFGPEHLHYSGDVPRLIELKVADSFDEPVGVMFLQSWAGDMSPGDPAEQFAQPTSVEMNDEWVRMEAIGASAAQTVQTVLSAMTYSDDPILTSTTQRFPINYEVIGYQPGEFDFPDGGAFCGGDNSECSTGKAPDMLGCLPMPADYRQAALRVGAARIGDITLFTLPGEPVTQYTLDRIAEIKAATGATSVWAVGYSMDHIGYLLNADDWFAGGYEPFFTFWGPKQGQFIGAMAVETTRKLYGLPFEVPNPDSAGPIPEPWEDGEPFVPENSVSPGTVVEQPAADSASQVARMQWNGGDPWVDAPVVSLEERDASGGWSAVRRFNGAPLDSRSYELALHLETVPEWNPENYGLPERQFIWSTEVFGSRTIPSTTGALVGRALRLRAKGTALVAGEPVPYEVVSDAFEF